MEAAVGGGDGRDEDVHDEVRGLSGVGAAEEVGGFAFGGVVEDDGVDDNAADDDDRCLVVE